MKKTSLVLSACIAAAAFCGSGAYAAVWQPFYTTGGWGANVEYAQWAFPPATGNQTLFPGGWTGPYSGGVYDTGPVVGHGPGPAWDQLTITYPAGSPSGSTPILVHMHQDNTNWDPGFGQWTFTGAYGGDIWTSFPPAGGPLYYKIDWTSTYTLVSGLAGNLTIGLNSTCTGPVSLHSGPAASGSGSFSGVLNNGPGAFQFNVAAYLYQGGGNAGHGILDFDLKVYVDTSPIPAPGGAALGALGMGLMTVRRRR